ncbi:MAG: hypothetical protein H6765_06535 [Candidatus Peribacteria bacterium]|nr:MAG: hypothetical protein H6765_06535 [Candidatus Peribacteria bacterium]
MSFTVLAVFLRYRWASILFRLTIDLAWVNIRAQVVLLTNPAQNTLFVYWGLVFLYAVIFYIARPGGM